MGEQVTEATAFSLPEGALARIADVPEGGALAARGQVEGSEESLVLLRKGEAVHAFLNVCPHAGRALDWAPGRFLIDSGHLVCAAHGASFTVPDGQCVAGPCRGQRLREVPVSLREGFVFAA
jgi:nitrite reductase/ring-hydroxylating ferredoxin subunit